MTIGSCVTSGILWVFGLIIFLLSAILFGYYARLERKNGLDSSTYLKIAIMGWLLNIISLSLIGLSTSDPGENGYHLLGDIDLGGLFCPGILAVGVTFILMIGVWIERMRRLAREQNDDCSK